MICMSVSKDEIRQKVENDGDYVVCYGEDDPDTVLIRPDNEGKLDGEIVRDLMDEFDGWEYEGLCGVGDVLNDVSISTSPRYEYVIYRLSDTAY